MDFQNPANHLDDHAITIGMVTKQRFGKLLKKGDICPGDQKKFYAGVRAFYVAAATQALKKLPFNNCVINNARFLNFDRRKECTFDSVEFFLSQVLRLASVEPCTDGQAAGGIHRLMQFRKKR